MQKDSLIYINNCRVQNLHGTKIENLTWSLNSGEAWLVIGPNGGGKADFLAGIAGENQIIPNNSSGAYSNKFENSCETVSLERAARLIQEERDLDESEFIGKIDEGRTGRRFICEVLGGPDAKHRNLPLPAIANRLETLPEVKLCGVEKILDRGLKFMSTGEIRRTLLCRALLSKSKLLILSDPFAGLDAQSRKILLEFFQTIVGKQKSGSIQKTIILAMERYHEIPETITNVLEFTDKKVSFCGTHSQYKQLLAKRDEEKSKTREEEKQEFVSEIKDIQNDTKVLQNENTAVIEPVEMTKTETALNDGFDHFDKLRTGKLNHHCELIKMNNVNVGWDGRKVLEDFSWQVFEGEHWLIRGPNGSGKTTLLELITGDNKQVFCNDVWLFGRKRGTGETIWDIKKNLGIVSYRWHVEYRMVGNTDLESVIISGFHDSIGLYEKKTDVEIQAAAKWLRLAGFEGCEHDTFNSLSYGEQRAVLILRAVVKSPKILILDEPCHGLDENYRQKILDLLETIAQTGTTTLLHVTHDPTEALPCEKHILELHPGEKPMYSTIISN